MLAVKKISLPGDSLLGPYSKDDGYTDCYVTEIPGRVSLASFVAAFYTTWIFKLERTILRLMLSKHSTDTQARQLAVGEIDAFSAWHLEGRNENQILMADFRRRTRSWLMVKPLSTGRDAATQLYFGSAVVPVRNRRTGVSSPGPGFAALLGFHRIYSKVLLYSARVRLEAGNLQ